MTVLKQAIPLPRDSCSTLAREGSVTRGWITMAKLPRVAQMKEEEADTDQGALVKSALGFPGRTWSDVVMGAKFPLSRWKPRVP